MNMQKLEAIDLTIEEQNHLEAAGISTDIEFWAERIKHRRYARQDAVDVCDVCPVCHGIEMRLARTQ